MEVVCEESEENQSVKVRISKKNSQVGGKTAQNAGNSKFRDQKNVDCDDCKSQWEGAGPFFFIFH